jgi:hypothetical protein
LLLLFFSVDDIHDVDAELGEEEDTVAIAKLFAAGGTLVFLEPGIADGNTCLSLNTPMAGKDPRITVFAAKGYEVALQTTILDATVEAERYLRIANIVMAVDEIGFDIALMKE